MNPYVRKGIIPIKEVEYVLKDIVLNNLDSNKKESKLTVNIRGENIYALSDRYKTFFTKGYSCCTCGIKATHFALERDAKSKIQQYHLNLYSHHKGSKEIMMTKDHIIPKSKGGEDHINNYQTMCRDCNSKKGNKLII